MELRLHLSVVIGITFLLVVICRCAYGCDGVIYEKSCVNILITQVKTSAEYASWNDVDKDCNTKGYQLVIISSQEKLNAITEYIAKTDDIKNANKEGFYIGLFRAQDTKRGVMKNWKWPSNRSLTFSNWAPGEPNVQDIECAGTYLNKDNLFVDVGCDDSLPIGLTYIYEYTIFSITGDNRKLTTQTQARTTDDEHLSTQMMTQSNVSLAYRNCTEGVADTSCIWGDVDLETLSNITPTLDDVEDVAKYLVKITNNVSNTEDANTIIYSALILKGIVSLNSTSDKVTTSVAASVDNLIEIGNDVTDVSEESRSASSTIIKSLEEQLATVASVGLNYTFSSKNLDIEVVQLEDDFASSGLVFYLPDNSSALLAPSEKYSSEFVAELDTSLELPAEAFDVGTAHQQGGNIPSVFILYKQSTLFSITNTGNNRIWTIGSRVISATVHRMESSTFKNPVVAVYTPTINKSVPEQDIKCVFWDFKLENGIGDWSSEGCVYNTTEDGRVICHCDHLTNFAVLMDFHGQADIITKRHHVLSMISLIGCCVSLTALLLTICTLIYTRYTTPFSREQHSARPKLILLNFAIALSLLYLVFVVGIEQTKHKPACTFISVLLHYFTISSISWMTIQAVNIYLSLVRIFPTHISKFRMKAYAFGWVVPLLPVLICLIVSKESYSNTDYCFINPGPVLYYGNIAVAGALFFTNFVIFILVIYVLTCSRSRQITRKNDESKFTTAKKQVSTAIGLSILLGLTWVFGFTAIAKSSNSNLRFSLQLLFCVFNSLQGLFVFLFFSVRPGDFKAFVTSCLSSVSSSSRPYEIANKYEKHDTTGQKDSMTHSTDV